MDSVLFGMVLLAIGWLVFWVCADHSKPTDVWWPFDYRKRDSVVPTSDEPKPNGVPWRSRQNAARPWKRSGF